MKIEATTQSLIAVISKGAVKRSERRQQWLKAPPGSAWAPVLASKLFDELFVAVNNAYTAFYLRFRRIAVAAFTARFETKMRFHTYAFARCT